MTLKIQNQYPSSSSPPACFGLSWSNSDPKCSGGYDATYTDLHGSHKRPACDYYTSCGTRSQIGRVVPPASLVRSPSVPLSTSSGSQPTSFRPSGYTPPAPSSYNPVPQHHGYQQMMPVNYQVPHYLTAQETEGGFWRRLWFTSLRSIGKSLGHSFAALFDHNPMGGKRE